MSSTSTWLGAVRQSLVGVDAFVDRVRSSSGFVVFVVAFAGLSVRGSPIPIPIKFQIFGLETYSYL